MKYMKKALMSMLALLLLLLCIMDPISVQASTASMDVTTDCKKPVHVLGEKLEENIGGISIQSRSKYAALEWANYSSRYFYEKLSANEKTLYDNMYNACMECLLTDIDLEYDKRNYPGTGFMSRISVPAGMTRQEVSDVWYLLVTNAPQFYFLNQFYMTDGLEASDVVNYIAPGVYRFFCYKGIREYTTNQMDMVITSWLDQIAEKSTTLEKETLAHYLIINNTTYRTTRYDDSCVGVFADKEAMDLGYAKAFALLCNGFGLQTIVVTDDSHAFNKVQLNGRWYNVDCSLDDHDDGINWTNFINLTDSELDDFFVFDMDQVWSKWGLPACTTESETTDPTTVYNGVDYGAVYNEQYYCTKYPDVASTYGGNSAAILSYFVNYGMALGHQGSADFNVQSYKWQYVDLRNAYGNDLKSYYMHYINSGKTEGRVGTGCTSLQGSVTRLNGVDYSAVFDFEYYISTNPDIENAFANDDVSALTHFVNYGMAEGRQGNNAFDVSSYLKQYADLRMLYRNNLIAYYQHFMNYGSKEGREGTGCDTLQNPITSLNGVDYSAVYDFNYYTSAHPDIKRAFAYDDSAAIEHFVNIGMSEGRQASGNFNVYLYASRYEDLRSAFGNDWKSYYVHYINSGIGEGRSGK